MLIYFFIHTDTFYYPLLCVVKLNFTFSPFQDIYALNQKLQYFIENSNFCGGDDDKLGGFKDVQIISSEKQGVIDGC